MQTFYLYCLLPRTVPYNMVTAYFPRDGDDHAVVFLSIVLQIKVHRTNNIQCSGLCLAQNLFLVPFFNIPIKSDEKEICFHSTTF